MIYTDASKLGCSAVLMQHGLDGTMCIIEIDLYSFNKTQLKWSAIEREGFGINSSRSWSVLSLCPGGG